jgi:hypothetical protein
VPSFSAGDQTKIATLRTLRAAGTPIEVHEIIKVEWPSPTGTIYYACQKTDEVASSTAPSVTLASIGVTPLQCRIIPGDIPNWFLPIDMNSEIGDEETEITFWDGDDAFTTLMETHGEGVKCSFYFWFPTPAYYSSTVNLLLPVWHGHMRYEHEVDVDRVQVKIAQGFRDADAMLPWVGHYDECQSPFPPEAGLTTQAQIDEIDCNYNNYNGIGSTGTAGFTSCPKLTTGDCVTRGIDPLRHYSHATMQVSLVNDQTHGPRLYSISQGNNTNLKEPRRVVMGRKRVSGMPILAFRRDYNNNHPDQGWFFGMYEVGAGPIQSISQVTVVVGGNNIQNAVPMHLNWQLGAKGQAAWPGLSTHGFSGTAYIVYNYGWINPGTVNPSDATASGVIEGCNDIRIYTTTSAYTTGYTTNRVWQLLYILTSKRWGYGLDYARFDIQSWIDAADWADDAVRFTDSDGTNWDHIRAESNVELIGRKVADQINDLCMAGRLSRPFLFNGKICIVPLKAHTSGELAAAPVFTDVEDYIVSDGVYPNIISEGEGVNARSTLRIGPRKSDKDLPNRIEGTINDEANNWLETPFPPIVDDSLQYKAGRVVGDGTRKTNVKTINLLGVTHRAQAVKLATSVLDLGEFDEGGLENNLPLKFRIWFIDALDLHPEKPIKVLNPKIGKYGFTYFRVKKIRRETNLYYSLEVQAYNKTYMDAFESAHTVTEGGGSGTCSVDTDCPEGYSCVNGVCIPNDICDLEYTSASYADGVLTLVTEPC